MKIRKIVCAIFLAIVVVLLSLVVDIYSGIFSEVISIDNPITFLNIFKTWPFYVLLALALIVAGLDAYRRKFSKDDSASVNGTNEDCTEFQKKINEALTEKSIELIHYLDPEKDHLNNEQAMKLLDQLTKTMEKTGAINNPDDPYLKKLKNMGENTLAYGTPEDHHRYVAWRYYNCMNMPKGFDEANNNAVDYHLTQRVFDKIINGLLEQEVNMVYLAKALKDFSDSTLAQAKPVGDNKFELKTDNKFVIRYLYEKDLNEVTIVDYYEMDNSKLAS